MPRFVLPAIVIIKRMIWYINDFMLLNFDNESLVVHVADPLRPTGHDVIMLILKIIIVAVVNKIFFISLKDVLTLIFDKVC